MAEEEILRPATLEDSAAWHRWRHAGRDSFVDGLPFSSETHSGWYEGKLHDPRSRLWTVLHEGQPVGMIGLNNIDHRQQSAEIAWVYIEPETRGIGTAAVRAVLRLAFRELNLHRIYLTVLAENGRAIHCYQKAGLREEGRLREAVFKAGERRDLILMAALRPEYETTRPASAESGS
jgi:RimJ/RimL family protein N-acetyltransferase